MSATQQETSSLFTVEIEPERDIVRVCPCGELDLATIPRLREPIDELVAAGFDRGVLDLRELTFLDSSGLRLVLELAGASRADGWELALIEGAAEVQRVFEVTGLRPLLPFVKADEARAL